MSIFNRNKHQHEWEETQNEYFPATMMVKRVSGYLSEEMEKLIFGYTRITHCCKTCPEIRVSDRIGDVKTGTRA